MRVLTQKKMFAILVLCTITFGSLEGIGFAGIPGNFCRSRQPEQCCSGRLDDCSVPLFGTLCYCDQFCNRTVNPDCCSDFWQVCAGISTSAPPPAHLEKQTSCSYKDNYMQHGMTVQDNCNICKCADGVIECEVDPCMINSDVINTINLSSKEFGWHATNYSEFWERKLSIGLALKTGTFMPSERTLEMYPIYLSYDPKLIPKEFDARRNWPGLIGLPREQGWCGASWAFSTLAVARDRLAIESSGDENVSLSPQNLISCDRRGQKGCEGGYVERAWDYLRKYGVVDEECYKYDSGTSGLTEECKVPRQNQAFKLLCAESMLVNYYRRDMYRMEPAYRISGTETDIQWEITRNGPVQALIKVYPDMFMYKSGIYSFSGVGDSRFSLHSVRLIGWGETEDNFGAPLKYWIAANSWGRNWGEDGFFRIKRGVNESAVEEFVIAVRAQLVDIGNEDNRIMRRKSRIAAIRRRHILFGK